MRLVLDISESRSLFFMELIKSLDYIQVVKETKNMNEVDVLNDLTDAFNDVKDYKSGEKKLKTAEELFNEL